jgi:anti-anti-sigma factor
MVSVLTSSGALIVKIFGDLDVMDAVALRNALHRIASESEGFAIVLDLIDAQRLGWRGMGLLVDERLTLARRGRELRLVVGEERAAPAGFVDELAAIAPVFKTVEEALALPT